MESVFIVFFGLVKGSKDKIKKASKCIVKIYIYNIVVFRYNIK